MGYVASTEEVLPPLAAPSVCHPKFCEMTSNCHEHSKQVSRQKMGLIFEMSLPPILVVSEISHEFTTFPTTHHQYHQHHQHHIFTPSIPITTSFNHQEIIHN